MHSVSAPDATRTARRASDSPAAHFLARAGLTARGVIYILVGWVAVLVALGNSTREADQQGALQMLAGKSYGLVSLWLLAIGFAAYALWRLSEAAFGVTGEPPGAGPRLKSLGRAVIYAGLSYLTFTVISGTDRSQAGRQQDITATAMQHTAGRVLVGVVGLAIVACGIALVVEGARKKFMKHLQTARMSPRTRRVVEVLGMTGTIARGLVFALAGVLVIDAAVTHKACRVRRHRQGAADTARSAVRRVPGAAGRGRPHHLRCLRALRGPLAEGLNPVADVAVVAHSRKSLGGGLPELRRILALEGVTDPLWYEVKKSRRAPKYARRAAAKGADVMFVWGGDGTVQRCIDAVADTDTAVAILPAGTANLLAANLNVPHDLAEAVRVGLHGDRRRLDTGSVNGERFTVMAGAGFDARMISDADRGAKDRLGRAAYVVTGIRNLRARRVRATIKVDGKRFFEGKVSCVLTANVGKILGGVEAFPQAQPDDGRLELGVVTARNPVEWARTFGRLALGHPEQSPFAKITQGTKFRIRFDEKIRFELDGGARPASKKLRIKVHPGSVTVCVPPRQD